MKHCAKCGEWKDEDEFSKDGTRKDGLFSYCKKCMKIHAAEYRKTHKEKLKADKIKYKEKNKEKWKEANKNYNLKKSFGITLKQYIAMFESQKGLCAICHQEEAYNDNLLCVDHDHERKIIRALLCRRCNLVLGYAQDNISVLENAVEYLKYWGQQNGKQD
jgi:hypothetical protein